MEWPGTLLCAAAEAMRRILIEYARKKQSLKHGGQMTRVELQEVSGATESPSISLLDLDAALTRLEQQWPEKAELVKLRYFAGLTIPEASRTMRFLPQPPNDTGDLPARGSTVSCETGNDQNVFFWKNMQAHLMGWPAEFRTGLIGERFAGRTGASYGSYYVREETETGISVRGRDCHRVYERAGGFVLK